jgi:hypothetical protein
MGKVSLPAVAIDQRPPAADQNLHLALGVVAFEFDESFPSGGRLGTSQGALPRTGMIVGDHLRDFVQAAFANEFAAGVVLSRALLALDLEDAIVFCAPPAPSTAPRGS